MFVHMAAGGRVGLVNTDLSIPFSKSQKERGVVFVEFLLVFPPLFLLFLIILQSAILRVSDLGVRHAAAATARSAIVILPDNPAFYDGAPINQIPREARCSEGVLGKIDKLAGRLQLGQSSTAGDGRCPGGPRMAAIHFAAVMRMLPFSPNPGSIAPEAFRSTLSRLGSLGDLAGAAAYAYGATAVTFPDLDQQGEVIDASGVDELTVRVTYLAYCGIPVARFFMCDSGRALSFDSSTDTLFDRRPAAEGVRRRKESARRKIATMRSASASPLLFKALLLSGARFRVVEAEATLPLITPPYEYQEK